MAESELRVWVWPGWLVGKIVSVPLLAGAVRQLKTSEREPLVVWFEGESSQIWGALDILRVAASEVAAAPSLVVISTVKGRISAGWQPGASR
ncbi:MAG: hypothetical protein AB9888_00230 [Bacteroidales bacterium]